MLPVLRQDWATTPFVGPSNRLDTLFDRFFGDDGDFLRPAWTGMPVAMWEDDDHVYIEADLPGVNENDLDITFHNGVLFIRGERKVEEGRTYLYNGRVYGRFERAITLPHPVDTDNVQARLTDGVLRIALAKSPEAKPKKIALKAS
jgi:HSP20 family protein